MCHLMMMTSVVGSPATRVLDFYCFENTDKTYQFDSDWGTMQKQYKNKNIIIITSKESRVDHICT